MCKRAIGFLGMVFLAASAVAAQAPDINVIDVHAVSYARRHARVEDGGRGRAQAVPRLEPQGRRVRAPRVLRANRPARSFCRGRDVEGPEGVGRTRHGRAHAATSERAPADSLERLRSASDKTVTVGPPPAAAGGQTIYVITHVDVVPNPQNDPPGLLRRLAEASRNEKGNVRFDILQHAMRANHFTIVEAWQSQSALDAHAAAAHTRQYRDTLQPMAGGPLDERLYKAVE